MFHKRSDIQESLEHSGHQILWLPPHGPDLKFYWFLIPNILPYMNEKLMSLNISYFL